MCPEEELLVSICFPLAASIDLQSYSSLAGYDRHSPIYRYLCVSTITKDTGGHFGYSVSSAEGSYIYTTLPDAGHWG